MKNLSLAFTPCPNDTFMFYGIVQKIIRLDYGISVALKDIETLNMEATQNSYDITKLSCFAYGKVAEHYCILRSGSALGKGCGPLLLGREGKKICQNAYIAIPGEMTTAHLLLRLFLGDKIKTVAMPFHQIMPAMQKGEIDFGVVIHEGRFTYNKYNLFCLQDLGIFWEQTFDLPIPLGIIAGKKSLDKSDLETFEHSISQSIEYAWANRESTYLYVKNHAQEMEESVLSSHIDLYVTKESQRLSDKGEKAICFLLKQAIKHNLLQPFTVEQCLME